MIRLFTRVCAIMLLWSLAGLTARADLDAYIKRPEPAYKWELRGEQKMQDGVVYDMSAKLIAVLNDAIPPLVWSPDGKQLITWSATGEAIHVWVVKP